MNYLKALLIRIAVIPIDVWEFTVEGECKEVINWTEWLSERTCYKMRTCRLIRWFRCRGHHWETYDIDDPTCWNGSVIMYGPMRYDAKKIKVCSKCRELRVVGHALSEKW